MIYDHVSSTVLTNKNMRTIDPEGCNGPSDLLGKVNTCLRMMRTERIL